MAKDYHKGYRLQCYIPEELLQRLDNYIQKHNDFCQAEKQYQTNKTDVVIRALVEFLQIHDFDITN